MPRRADAIAALLVAALGAAVSNVRADLPAEETPVWTQLHPATHPTSADSLVYDPVGTRVLSFRSDGEVWSFDGTSWSQLTAAVGPQFDTQPGIAFDARRGDVVLVTSAGDTWTWSAGAWHAAGSGGPTGAPGGCGPALVFADALGAVVALTAAPDTTSTVPVQVFSWDGATWSPLPGANAPQARIKFGATYDRRRKRAVIFGGYLAGTTTDETWEWDGLAWSHPTPVVKPVPRELAQIAYDSARGRAIFFGGPASPAVPAPRNDTWEWDGTTWTQLQGGAVPLPRLFAAIAYDEARRRTVLFGGGGANDPAENDTWEYSTYNGACASADACDTSRCDHGRCCFVQCGPCETCDDTGAGCTLVQSADDPSSCTGERTCDPTGHCKPKPGQACAENEGCASGRCAGGACCAADCGAFGCDDGGACRASCVIDGDCATGAICEHGVCAMPASSCASAHTSRAIATGALRECTPYVCSPHDGRCRTTCETSDDCDDGFSCNAAGACVTQRLGGPGGCSAAPAAPRPTRQAREGWTWLLFAAALVVRLRRRAR